MPIPFIKINPETGNFESLTGALFQNSPQWKSWLSTQVNMRDMWNNYLKLVNDILQGEMPAGYEALAESIRKQTQAAGQNLLNRAISKMAAQGILRGGLSKQVARDVSAMTASDTANALAQLRGSLFRSALSLLPSAISAERSYELAKRRLELGEEAGEQQSLANFWNALGQWGSSVITALPWLIKFL